MSAGKKSRTGKRATRPTWAPKPLQPVDPWSWAVLALALIGVFLVYWRAMHFPLVDWDDPVYLKFNEELNALSWNEVKRQFTLFVIGNYHPITMLSLSLDLTLAGANTSWYHSVNVVLHALNTFLVFWFLVRTTGMPRVAALAALLWCLDPLRVESVAWVSARKDLLMLFFGTLTLIAYTGFLRSRRPVLLALAFVLFLLACLSKGMAVAFAPTLLVIDLYWQRDLRARGPWLEKIPFFLAALVLGLVAVKAQAAGEALGRVDNSVVQRVIAAGANVLIYLAQQTVPVGLNARYGWPTPSEGLPLVYPLLFTGLILGVWYVRNRLRALEVFGALFLIAHLLLILQVLPVGQAIRADRYTYVGGIGWAVLVVALTQRIWDRTAWPRTIQLAVVVVYGAVLGFVSWQRTFTWKDPLSLWNDILKENPQAPEFHLNRGITYAALDSLEAAERDMTTAIRLRAPDDYIAYFNRATFRADHGRYAEALDDLLVMFKAGSTRPELIPNMIYALMKLGKCEDVVANCTAYLKQKPRSPDVLNMRAWCLLQKGDTRGASADLDRSEQLKKEYGALWYMRARVSLAQGDTAKACTEFERSNQWPLTDPDFSRDRDSTAQRLCR